MKNEILNLISINRDKIQMNFNFMKIKKIQKSNSNSRLINIEKYQTNEVLVKNFYKDISRF